MTQDRYNPNDDVKERVREAIDIVDLIGRDIQLKRQGRYFVGLCPWHDDTRPSLQVNSERQSYKCWVCDKGGDAFSWVMAMEGIEFRESLEILADQAGIELGKRGIQVNTQIQQVYDALESATQLYEKEFWKNQEAKDYMTSRGLEETVLKQFRVGFAPNDFNFIGRHLMQFSDNTLRLAGLRREGKQTGEYGEPRDYDFFRNRILFPLIDNRNRVIGFAGRILPGDENPAKYLNSPESPVFRKSEFFYGLNTAARAITKTGSAIIFEGYTDVIQAHQAGIENSIAVAGTAFTSDHAAILSQKFKNSRITLCLDGDKTGQKRAFDHSKVLIARGNYKIALLPEGTDPDDVILSEGAGRLEEILKQGIPIFDFYLDCQTNDRDLSSPEEQVALMQTISPDFKKVPPHFLGIYINSIAKKTGCSESTVECALLEKDPIPKVSPGPPNESNFYTLPTAVKEVGSRRALAEFKLLRGLIDSPDARPYLIPFITNNTFTSPERKAVYDYFLKIDNDQIPLLAPLWISQVDKIIQELRQKTPQLNTKKLKNLLLSPTSQKKSKLPELEECITIILGDEIGDVATRAKKKGHSLESVAKELEELKKRLE